MSVECFMETNILVYAAAGRGTEEAKRRRALEIIENENFGISTQVLQEIYLTVVWKIETPLSPEQALEWIEQFAYFPCISIDVPIVKIGVEFSERYQISYWDGAILACAEALGATTLYREDLNHEQFDNNVRLLNPFR
jgi:predicted nucleic acid-binding protein